MSRTRNRLKAFIIHSVIALQLTALCLPLSARAFAQETGQTGSNPTATETIYGTPPEGTPRPNGVAGHTYRYNLTTGMWENNYFIWNPNNNQTTAKYPEEHKFNASSNYWEVWQWRYVASSGKYEYRVTATYPPEPTPEPAPAQTPAPDTTSISDTGPDSSNTIIDSPGGTIDNTGPSSTNSLDNAGNGSVSQTGPYSDNSISVDNNGQANYDAEINVGVVNNVDSTATTGNANVLQNTTAGDATTGDALAMANIMNMLQSTWGSSSQAPEIYVADIQGDHVGDIVLDPSILGMTNTGCGCDLEVNVSNNASIENNVDLLASSGDATVSMNTSAGDATTGDATAVANIINMINSSITSGQSFLGVLNIHGDLEGDVLVAGDIIDQLLAANVPTTEVSLCNCGDVMADFTNNQTITNNVTTTAQSGQANVSYNTSAGDATSGDAETSITVFNLTGRTVIGENGLLVFVNVLGEWVGFITDAPGATAAMYGSGVTADSACGDCGDLDIEAANNYDISNNVNVAAVTGDANVTYNTEAGDATTGDANAAANISNITGSNFALSGWFGMLFINVLGDWHGSFGTDTEYGGIAGGQIPNPVAPSPTRQSLSSGLSKQPSAVNNAAFASGTPSNVRVFNATFDATESGNPVVASVSETAPPASGEETPGYTTPPSDSSLVAWGLLIGLSVLTYVIFRRKPGSHPSGF